MGLKSTGKPDLALVVNDGPHRACAVVFTSNRAQANPILWSRKVAAQGTARAIVLNSGGANCFTGEFGYETTRLTAEAVAQALNAEAGPPAGRGAAAASAGGAEAAAGGGTSAGVVQANEIVVCSTGLIGSGD